MNFRIFKHKPEVGDIYFNSTPSPGMSWAGKKVIITEVGEEGLTFNILPYGGEQTERYSYFHSKFSLFKKRGM